MILVDDAGGVYPAINHAPWDGITLADYVMPFFLFIIGVAMAIVFKVRPDVVDHALLERLHAFKHRS